MAKFVFVSNYINHHQIPFCQEMMKLTDGDFYFIQTEEMDKERIQMGWGIKEEIPYLKLYYQEPGLCQDLIDQAEVCMFGGIEDDTYIKYRLDNKMFTLRCTERIYKGGQWKAISPRGLLAKYKSHIKYRNSNVYLLCSGAYVASDFNIIKAYPGKKFVWGYLTEAKEQNIQEHASNKGYGEDKIPYLLWVGRFIDCKRVYMAVRVAEFLKAQGLKFHMDIVGSGPLEPEIRKLASELEVDDVVNFTGFLAPEEVRSLMEKANIHFMTSDRIEGWGAVVNEAMNSGCAEVVDSIIGSAPYIVRHNENGLIYKSGSQEELNQAIKYLIDNPDICQEMGYKSYQRIMEYWNPQYAANELWKLIEKLQESGPTARFYYEGDKNIVPCMPAPVISERKMLEFCKGLTK